MTVMTLRGHGLLAGAVLIAGMVLPACSSDTVTAPAETADPIPVAVATVAMTEVADTFEAGGVVQAQTTATIMARILAPILEVRVAPGDRVRTGQVLIVLDGRDLAAQARRARAGGVSADQSVIAASAERQEADAALVLARATHARIAGLNTTRSATAQELDNATGALRAAEARASAAAARAQVALSEVEAARASSEAAETIEAFSRIAAPFDGVVTEKLVEPGNMATPGAPLVRMEDTRGFRLDVRVDESRIAQISPRATVQVTLNAGTDTPKTIDGTVTEVSRAVDAGSRAFLVKIALPDAAGLRSGTFGRARFSSGARRALTVPAGALVRRGQVTSVFVVNGDVARVRLVDVSGTEVRAGLSDGETVIVDVPPALVDGRRVLVGGR
jgi:RND family efflux transporter MFP subunit